INDAWLSRWILRQTARLEFHRPIVWTYNPLIARVARRLDGSMIIYHAVDDLAAAPHMPAAAIQSAERDLAACANVVFTTSPALQSRLAALRSGETHFLPNVADYDHFSKAREAGPIPADLAEIPRPRIGFIGAVSGYKVDFTLIAEIA